MTEEAGTRLASWLGRDGEGAELVAQRRGWCVALTAADQVSHDIAPTVWSHGGGGQPGP